MKVKKVNSMEFSEIICALLDANGKNELNYIKAKRVVDFLVILGVIELKENEE